MIESQDLRDMHQEYMNDPRFDHMRKPGINFVPGIGPVNPDLMLIGEAPGRLENARQIPFLGRAGITLQNILEDSGLSDMTIYFTNSVKYLPTDKNGKPRKPSTPSVLEMEFSRSYILREIDIVGPKIIGLCGRVPLQTVLPSTRFNEKTHGSLIQGKYVPLYHPAYESYNPSEKYIVRKGYAALKEYLQPL